MILKTSYQVLLADGAMAGLDLAREAKPDMAFVDIKMPEMEGTEVLRRLKEIDPEIEVALVTAYAAIDTAQQAVRHGAVDYITKPFAVQEIITVTERALQRRQENMKQKMLLQQLQPAAQALSWQLTALDDSGDESDQREIYEGLAEAHSSIETQLSKIARLNAIGEIAAEVAHDVSNFLTTILLRMEMLLMNLKQSPNVDADSIRGTLQEIVQAARDGAEAVQRISGISKSDPYEPSQLVDVSKVAEDVVNLTVGQFREKRGTRVNLETGEIEPIFGSPTALRTAVMNIVINARQALSEGGEVWVRTRQENGWATIEVADSGQGIPPDLMDKITQPFFTTKGEDGSGLGLSVARKVVARHEGEIEFDSIVGEGTTVTIRLPVADENTRDQLKSGGPEQAAPASRPEIDVPDVLVVDDDAIILNTMKALLVGAGMVAESASDAAEGLQKFEGWMAEARRAPKVVVTDLRMPGLLGTDMAKRIKEISPETRVILISGYLGEDAEVAQSPYLDGVVSKPFKFAELLKHVQGAM
jgi:signal transduction histidine kinase